MRVLVAVLFAFAVVFAADTTSTTVGSTFVSSSFSISATTSDVVTSSVSKPATRSESAGTSFTTSYSVTGTETQTQTESVPVISTTQHSSTKGFTSTGEVTGTGIVTGSTPQTKTVTATESTPVVSTTEQSSVIIITATSAVTGTGIVTASTSQTKVATTTESVPVYSTTQQTSSASITGTTFVTGSGTVSGSTEQKKTVTATITQVAPTVPDLSGRWDVSDPDCDVSNLFDSAYNVAMVTPNTFKFTPVNNAKFAGGVIEEYLNGSFVGVSAALAFCHGTISGNEGDIICVIPPTQEGQKTAVCTANLKRAGGAATTVPVPTGTTIAPFTDLSGRWAVSNVKCQVSADAFDKAYDVTKVNNTFYQFTPLDTGKYSGGLVFETSMDTFVGVSSALNGCVGKITGPNSASISCLVEKTQCSANLNREATPSTMTRTIESKDTNSGTLTAISFVLVAAAILF